MAANEKDTEFWTGTYALALDALDSLAYATKPRIVSYPYEGEAWKERAQIDEEENACYLETDDFIRDFCRSHDWSEKSVENVRYFTGERLRWALPFIRVLTIPCRKTGLSFLPGPKESGYDFLEWLLIDGYREHNLPTPHIPFPVVVPQSTE